MRSDSFENEDLQDEGPSRSELKRQAETLQKLGETLVKLSPGQLKHIPLSEDLAEAIDLAQRIKASGGRRRQLQLIGKLMRQEDPEPIQQALARLENRSASAVAEHQRSERWRDRLLSEGDSALAEFLQAHPNADPQRLRQLIRAARREQAADKPPRSARELFRAIREAQLRKS